MTSLRARLLASLIGALLLAALVLGVATYRSTLAEVESLFDYQLQQMALSLRDQGEIAPDQARALADEKADFVVQIWHADGRVIYASRRHDALPTRAVLGFADISDGTQGWRSFAVSDLDRVVQVAQPLSIRSRLAASAAGRAVLPLVLLAPPLALLLGWLVSRMLAPLSEVARQVRARAAESLEPLPVQGLPDEVRPLLEALNGLLQRLSTAFGTQRSFVADAAHELRSPLTALKLQIGLLRRATRDEERAPALEALAAGIDRAARLVEQLLTLARSEPGAMPAPHEPIDLSVLAQEALADTVPQAAARGTTIELDAQPGARVLGDRQALTALVRNLADNAVRYAPSGARVDVSVARTAEGVRLRVDDTGPGIAPADRERVFDRFVRRPGESSESGSGLGLAIVRNVVERHGGRVTLGDAPGGGLRVEVWLPACAT